MDININVTEMSEKQFVNFIKKLLISRYPEAKDVSVVLWAYDKPLDSIKISPTYEFKSN